MRTVPLAVFSISPETLMGQRTGIAWLLHPIKYGNPVPELAVPLPWWGIAWLDLPPTVLLFIMYIVAFSAIPRIALCLVQSNWCRPAKIVGCIALVAIFTSGVWCALIVRGNLPLDEMKLIYVALVFGLLTIGLWPCVQRLRASLASVN